MPAPVVTPTLARTLSFWLVTFYGLGTTLGAGIYVLIGAVAAQAGVWTPFAFLLAAAIASVTALSYAELVRRLPLCAGEASYVEAAFGRPALTRAVGLAVVVAGIASAATIVSGVTAYLALFVTLPRMPLAATVVLGLTAIAAYGMALSAWVASALTMAAIAGLVFVVAVGADAWQSASLAVALTPPRDLPALGGIVAGAFLAFYAFLGFEDMINVAEETRAAERVLPRAILTALVVATLLYLAVALTVVTALPADVLATEAAPLARLVAVRGWDPRILAAIGIVAIVNGALVQIVKAARVLYGLARGGHLSRNLAHVARRTRTPVRATLLVGAAILACVLSLELVPLARLTSYVALVIFAIVNVALATLRWQDQQAAGRPPTLAWRPLCGLLLVLALLFAEILRAA